jgi:hypothetical protein
VNTLTLAAAMSLLAVTGCAGDYALQCEESERYESSEEVPPVRVPGDLSVPDESEALRIPPPPPEQPSPESNRGPCLESPPEYQRPETSENA